MKPINLKWNVTLLAGVLAAGLTGAGTAQNWGPSGPIPRYRASAVFNTSKNRMVVFGGTTFAPNTTPAQNLNDVWQANAAGGIGLDWVSIKPVGTPPGARNGQAAVYDEANDRMIIFGGGLGMSSPCANDVWVLSNAASVSGTPTWTQLTPSGGPPAPRTWHGAVYDPNTNSMIVFGGEDCVSTQYNDVWVLSNANGLGGQPTWTQLTPSGTPPAARAALGVVYDSADNRLIVFGGEGGARVLFNDVWVLSNANGSGGTPLWTQLSPSGGPPAARFGLSAVYDAASNRMMIFGGQATSDQADTWVLSNASGLGGAPTWTKLGPFTTFAEARVFHNAVYNSSTNRMVIFGGQTPTGPASVWVLRHANGL